MKCKKTKRKIKKESNMGIQGMGTFFKKRKIYFLYIRSESKVHLLIGLGAAKNLETCCCVHSKWRGGGKMKRNELSPIQLGEGISTLRQGFIQEGLCPSLDQRKYHSSSACVMYFVMYRWNVCASLCMQQIDWKVRLSHMVKTVASLTCCARDYIFFLSIILHSFYFLPHSSPGLPSSHPNQRTHRPLLGTPCPGNPPCTAGYLEHNIHRCSVVWRMDPLFFS